jgi:hypothetical protein
MMDIVELNEGEDMKVYDSIVSKAGNVLAVQIGALEYAQDFGVDLRFFLTTDFQLQTESFKAYLVQRLIEHQVNVAKVLDSVQTLVNKYNYLVGDTRQSNGGLIL